MEVKKNLKVDFLPLADNNINNNYNNHNNENPNNIDDDNNNNDIDINSKTDGIIDIKEVQK